MGVAALVAIAASAAAQSPSPQPRQVWIEDPSGHALDAFHAALRRARAGEGKARVMVWGGSHVASDQYPGFLRDAWQRRFGDGGPGFVMPALPFSLYAHQRVTVAPAGAWHVARVRGAQRASDAYGPLGIALDASGPARAFARLVPGARPIDRVAIYFARQPGGGSVEVTLAPRRAQRIATAGEGADLAVLEGATRAVELRAVGDGPVRIFGVSLERSGAGVIVDALGIPGARMRDRLPWSDAALRRQLEALAPDLIVLAYGTNESGITGRPIARYRAEVDEAVRRARLDAPRASCLLIGPSDWPLRENGAWIARPRTAEVIAVQREVAARRGCGFFDLVALQGGPRTMPRWVEAGLALGDHVHFTDEGHRIIARILSRALLRGFE